MAKIVCSLSILFLYCYQILLLTEVSDACETPAMIQCGNVQAEVIADECQSRECLKWENDDDAPLPIILETICSGRAYVYAYFCTVHGENLIWYIGNEDIASFRPQDSVGRTVSDEYPPNSPVYNVTATLTHVSKIQGTTGIPVCVSILTVQPLNESQIEDIDVPFKVSCLGHCQPINENNVSRSRSICQAEQYKFAATPYKPRYVNVIQDGSIISVNWLPPENDDETTIDHYELTLDGSNTNSTTYKVDAASSLPYYLNVTNDNYTVSVTAVDVCGQRSEPSELANFISSTQCITEQQKLQDLTAGAIAAIVLAFIVALLIIPIAVYITVSINKKCQISAKKDVTCPSSPSQAQGDKYTSHSDKPI